MIHDARGANPEDSNSAVEVVFQVGHEEQQGGSKYAFVAALQLLMHLAKEPAFDMLRTKEQLGCAEGEGIVNTSHSRPARPACWGFILFFRVPLILRLPLLLSTSLLRSLSHAPARRYMVFSGAMSHGDGAVAGARFIVQSEVQGPAYLDDRVEAFVATLRALVAALTPEAFAANQQAVSEEMVEKFKNLTEETNSLWGRISNGSCDFGRRYRVAAAVRALTLDHVLAFFDTHFSVDSPSRRKLSARIWGSKHPVEPASVIYDATRDNPTNAPAAASEAAPGAALEAAPEVAAAATEDSAPADAPVTEVAAKAAPAPAEELAPVLAVPGKVIRISSPHAFQRTMPLFAHRTPRAQPPAPAALRSGM